MPADARVSALVTTTDRRCMAQLPAAILERSGGCGVWLRSPQGVQDAFVRGLVPGVPIGQVAAVRAAVTNACFAQQAHEQLPAHLKRAASAPEATPFELYLRGVKVSCESWIVMPAAQREAYAAGFLGLGPMLVERAAYTPFDQWVRTPAPQAEVDRVLADFRVEFAPGFDPWAAAAPDLPGSGIMLANALRFLQWLPLQINLFPWPLPRKNDPGNSYSLYDYFRGLGLLWRIEPNAGAMGYASGTTMTFNHDALATMSRFEVTDVVALIVHEVRHTAPGGAKGHPCNTQVILDAMAASNGLFNPNGVGMCDPSFAFSGAYAVEYLFYKSLRDHAHGLLDSKAWLFTERMREIVQQKICDPSDEPYPTRAA